MRDNGTGCGFFKKIWRFSVIFESQVEDFIEVLESANQSCELIATPQSILGVETGAVAVC
ncbi:MAG: hypothetical protein ACT6FC_02805 [Methanosarcinaceae archaeon]